MLSSVTEPDPDGGGPLTAPVTTLVYDAEGHVTSTTDPLGHAVTRVYNAAGYETSETDPLNHTTSQGGDSGGQVASVTDPLSNQTTFQYTALGQQSQVTEPASGVLYSNYTSQGWLSTQQQSGGGTGTYTYNDVGWKTDYSDLCGDQRRGEARCRAVLPDGADLRKGQRRSARGRLAAEGRPIGDLTDYLHASGSGMRGRTAMFLASGRLQQRRPPFSPLRC